MTTTTKSPEVPVSSGEKPRVTAWDNVGDGVSNGEPLPPSIPPANRHIASPVDIVGRGSAQSASSPETASADSSADESTRYEDRGRQIISGATERVRTGSEELFGRAKPA